ncbi:MAG: glycosyltransferase [Bacteroidales bacterium]|nr:glycosyltransferase [Bacteroidales bacterium]MDY4175746.1 glycosyltransferase [Bacteroidales bacterium]
MSNSQISIIVPVYNSEKYLNGCIDSILCQSFTDWQLTLVNDGSTDTSRLICEEYASKDSRICVINKPNGGCSSARNAGIESVSNTICNKLSSGNPMVDASDKFFYFPDSDDRLEPNALQILHQAISNGKFDLAIAGYNRFDESGTKIFGMRNSNTEVLTHKAALKEMFVAKDHNYQGYLWNKLFRADIIINAKIRFDERISFNEDRLFITQYLCASTNNVAYTTTPVYNYYQRQSGAMGSLEHAYNPLYATDFDAFIKIKESIFNHTNDKELRTLALRGICRSYYMNHELMVTRNGYDDSIHKKLLRSLIRHRALSQYFILMLKPALRQLVLLLCPKIATKRHNKNKFARDNNMIGTIKFKKVKKCKTQEPPN